MNNFKLDFLIDHVNQCVINADKSSSKITNEILNIEGMSGSKTRHLYNNLCNIDNANYLEVGTWKGSSFVSSIFKNNIKSIAIDNWSEFNGSKNNFIKNVEKFCPESRYIFFEKNSFEITETDIHSFFDSIDIYLYDGCHKYESHKSAITHFKQFLSKYSIVLIDDWRNENGSWQNVIKGTYDGFDNSNLKIHHKIEIPSKQEINGSKEYWNGICIFICERTDI